MKTKIVSKFTTHLTKGHRNSGRKIAQHITRIIMEGLKLVQAVLNTDICSISYCA